LASRRQEIGISKTGSVTGNEEPGLMGWFGVTVGGGLDFGK